jgi:hypothetical protein
MAESMVSGSTPSTENLQFIQQGMRGRVHGQWKHTEHREPSVFGRNLQCQPVRGVEHLREMPLVTRMQELQAEQKS